MKYLMYSYDTGVTWQRSLLFKLTSKTAAILATAVAAAVLVIAPVFAHAPTVTMDTIGPLSYATFPQTYNVTGQVCHSSAGNVSAVTDITLYINTIQEGSTVNPNAGNDLCANFSLPWSISAAGTYDVMVTARHGNDVGDDSEAVVVSGTVVVTECPAAPAVAAALLKQNNVKPKVVSDKNYISSVAKQMGPQNSFNTFAACDTSNYRTAVDAYLDNNLGAY
jgi:hypothetical protein